MIKLTDSNGSETYINEAHILQMYVTEFMNNKLNEVYTGIIFINGITIYFKETPEEIINLIEGK